MAARSKARAAATSVSWSPREVVLPPAEIWLVGRGGATGRGVRRAGVVLPAAAPEAARERVRPPLCAAPAGPPCLRRHSLPDRQPRHWSAPNRPESFGPAGPKRPGASEKKEAARGPVCGMAAARGDVPPSLVAVRRGMGTVSNTARTHSIDAHKHGLPSWRASRAACHPGSGRVHAS